MFYAGETLGMTHKQHAARSQNIPISLNKPLLRRLVKIDHDVAAEDKIERPTHRPLAHEIKSAEANKSLNIAVYFVNLFRLGLSK